MRALVRAGQIAERIRTALNLRFEAATNVPDSIDHHRPVIPFTPEDVLRILAGIAEHRRKGLERRLFDFTPRHLVHRAGRASRLRRGTDPFKCQVRRLELQHGATLVPFSTMCVRRAFVRARSRRCADLAPLVDRCFEVASRPGHVTRGQSHLSSR